MPNDAPSAGATVRQIREQARKAKAALTKKKKPKAKRLKLATSLGWVMIFCRRKTVTKGDYIESLTVAMEAVQKLED